MTDYLCDEKYDEIIEIPSSVEPSCAIKNIDLFIKLFADVIVERNYLKMVKPEISLFQQFLSSATLPYLLTVGAGTQTVFQFLTDTWEDVMTANVDELKKILVPLAALFHDEQLSLAYERLILLRRRLEGDDDDYDY